MNERSSKRKDTMRVVNKRARKDGPYGEHGKDLYIGRGVRGCDMMNTPVGQPGWLGNPVRVGFVCQVCGQKHTDGGSTLKCYRGLLWKKIGSSPEFCKTLLAIPEDTTLVCWCNPAPCHGDVLVEILRKDRAQIDAAMRGEEVK